MRLQFRVWDKSTKRMLYSNFVIRHGNPPCMDPDFVKSMLRVGQQIEQSETGTMGAEPLQTPKSMEINDKITELMDDYAATWSLIDWSNWYGLDFYEVMQVTGFHDKDGNLIWEDDVLVNEDGIQDRIQWLNGCYVWNGCPLQDYKLCTDNSEHFGGNSRDLKIIGNVYEGTYNPEETVRIDERIRVTS